MMPELPEVESIRRGLVRARLRAEVSTIRRSTAGLRIGTSRRRENLQVLVGARPHAVLRRGKYLVIAFERGKTELGLLVHLGMSGSLRVCRADAPTVPHTHLVVELADRRELRFVDPRRFGSVRAAPLHDLLSSPPLCRLGPEPIGSTEFSGAHLERVAGNSRRVIRDVLLDQAVVAGVGNIYAIEALYAARIHPLVRAHRLSSAAWDALAHAITVVLRQAIRNRGTTLRDYRDAQGAPGRNREALAAYGRAGKPCLRCGAILVGFQHGGRSGVYCPVDQKRARGVVHVRP